MSRVLIYCLIRHVPTGPARIRMEVHAYSALGAHCCRGSPVDVVGARPVWGRPPLPRVLDSAGGCNSVLCLQRFYLLAEPVNRVVVQHHGRCAALLAGVPLPADQALPGFPSRVLVGEALLF